MSKISVSIQRNLEAPQQDTQLVVFSSTGRYLPQEKAARHIGSCIRFAKETGCMCIRPL
jgi:hypothetical protein